MCAEMSLRNAGVRSPLRDVGLSEDTLAAHLQPIRGLALAHAIYAGFEVGLFDFLQGSPRSIHDIAIELDLDPDRLDGLLDYFENEGLLSRSDGHVELTAHGRDLQMTRPWYELLIGGYAQTFAHLSSSLKTGAPYAERNGASVAIGSCGISEHDALPMVLQLMREGERPSAVVDLGCGDGTFIAQIAAEFPDVPAIGVEPDRAARSEAEVQAAKRNLTNLQILAGDALNPPEQALALPPGVCYITAFVLQELLAQAGEVAVIDLLRKRFESDPDGSWIVIEVDRRHPLLDEPSALALGYYNPYFLIHRVTEQRLLAIEEWKRIYAQAGLTVAAEVFPEPNYDPLGIKFGHLLRRAESTT